MGSRSNISYSSSNPENGKKVGGRSNISLVGNTTYGINCGGGACIYDCKSGSNLLIFKTICGAGTVSIISGDTTVTISGNDTNGIEWSGSTVNGIGTYMSISGICAQPNLTFDGSILSVNGAVVTNTLQVTNGATNGYILTSDANGNATWQTGGGGTSYWDRIAGSVYPSTTGDDVMLQNACVTWSGTTACIIGYLQSTNSYLCIVNGTSYVQIVENGSIQNRTSTLYVIDTSNNNQYITSTGDIGTQTTGQKIGIRAGSQNSTSQAGSVCVMGGNNTSTGSGGDVCICAGDSTSGSGGDVVLRPGTGGKLMTCCLPAKTSETCVLYINAGNCISTGVGGGGSTISGFTDATFNVSIGCRALTNYNTPVDNIAIGRDALKGIGVSSTGDNNIALGVCSLTQNTSGYENIGIGSKALCLNTTGNNNIALGQSALIKNTIGNDNIGLGHNTLCENTSGIQNIAIGLNALCNNTTGNDNIAYGRDALYSNINGNHNIGIGCHSLITNTGGDYNISLGNNTLYNNTTGCYNIAQGRHALYYNTSGDHNIAQGFFALSTNSTGCHNIALGCSVLNANTTGCHSVAIGSGALYANTTGCYNIAIGSGALCSNTSGRLNVAQGYLTLCSNTTGINNVAIAREALLNNTYGYGNIAIGTNALRSNTTGCNIVAIGCGAGYSETSSNKLHISNCGICSLIIGDFVAKTICNGGNNTTWDTSSDCRIKECVNTIPNALLILCALNPISFDYTTGYTAKVGWDENIRVDNYGFIAQEFETIFPNYVKCSEGMISCVSGSTVSDLRTMNTGHLVPILVKAIHELEARIKILEV